VNTGGKFRSDGIKDNSDGTITGFRIRQAHFVFGCLFLFFLGLLIRYQIIDSVAGTKYIRPAFLQRRESVPVSLARGRILDRNGIPLHCPCWHPALAVFPSKIDDKGRFAEEVAALVGMDETKFREILDSHTGPFKILREVPAHQMEKVMSHPIPGLAVIPEEIRYGPESLARHVVGHIRPNAYLNPKDNAGESGLESWYQSGLAGGTPAWAGTLVTGEGSEIPGTGIRIGSSGDYPKDLLTTIDVTIQYSVERILDEEAIQRGSVVVLDVKSGEILAMASRPQYDQNHPGECFQLPDAPFVNRGISDFTPGSIWKVVVLALALEKGYVAPDEVFECQGRIAVGSTVVNCGSSREGHGTVTLKQAVAQSCNCTLIEVGLRIPPQELVNWALECGFGKRLRIPLPQESTGVLPDPHSMMAGDVANYSIGQGYLTATPVQAACFYRSVVCGGKWASPVLIADSSVNERIIFSESVSRFLQEALLLSAQEGTGEAAWVHGFGSAGKTGTAEMNGGLSPNHAWFVGWTPVLAPKYVICVFCERAGDGPTLAAPLFKKIAQQLLQSR